MNEPLDVVRSIIRRAVSEGFDEALAVVNLRNWTMAKFANNTATIVQSWNNRTVNLYLTKSGRILILENLRLSEDVLTNALLNAKENADRVEQSELYAPLPKASGRPLNLPICKTISENMDKIVESVTAVIDSALTEGANRAAGTLSAGVETTCIINSLNDELCEKSSFINVYVRAFKDDNSGHWAWTSRYFDEKMLKETGRRAGMYASMTYSSINVEPGRYTAVLSPLVFGNLVNYIAWAASAFAVLIGMSFLSKYKQGEKVASELFTLKDAPHDEKLSFSRGFDDEGVATFSKLIIERGELRNLLHNSKTAKMFNTTSTGNAGLLMPRPWNLVVEGGTLREDEMVKLIDKGFFVLNNWYTRLQNYVEGQFSTVTRDLLLYVENGEIRGSVKRMRIADTFPHILANIDGLSREVYDISWWEVEIPTRLPFVIVRNVLFTKPEV